MAHTGTYIASASGQKAQVQMKSRFLGNTLQCSSLNFTFVRVYLIEKSALALTKKFKRLQKWKF
jgi:hypothetical protein